MVLFGNFGLPVPGSVCFVFLLASHLTFLFAVRVVGTPGRARGFVWFLLEGRASKMKVRAPGADPNF